MIQSLFWKNSMAFRNRGVPVAVMVRLVQVLPSVENHTSSDRLVSASSPPYRYMPLLAATRVKLTRADHAALAVTSVQLAPSGVDQTSFFTALVVLSFSRPPMRNIWPLNTHVWWPCRWPKGAPLAFCDHTTPSVE